MNKLAGKVVLITRAAHQSLPWMTRLAEEGAKPVHVPLIEIAQPSDGGRKFDAAVDVIGSYDGVIFTSRNAVESFLARMSRGGTRFLPARLFIAAVGPATSSCLRGSGVVPTIVARDASASGLLHAFDGVDLNGKRLLHPRARNGRDDLPAGLRARGAIVDVVEAYQTVVPRGLDRAGLIDLVDLGSIDVALFASPSAVEHFTAIVGGERARAFSRRHAVASIGPVTEAAVTSCGMRSDRASTAAMQQIILP